MVGHFVVQLRLTFRPMKTDYFITYVQHFNVNASNAHSGATGMHSLRQAINPNGSRIGDVVPVSCIRSAAHLIPDFGKEAHPRLTRGSSYELSDNFWLNKYWMKELYYALCPL